VITGRGVGRDVRAFSQRCIWARCEGNTVRRKQ